MTGAEVITKILERHHIKRIFGIPGAQTLELFDAFTNAQFETILTTHEQCAAFMADAVSRVSDEIGVVSVVPGPGLTNLFSGLGEALLDSSPIVILVAGVNTDLPYTFQLHEIDQVAAATPLAKSVIRIEGPEEIEGKLSQALFISTNEEPGPVVVEIPVNILAKSAPLKKAAPRADHPDPLQPIPALDEVIDELLSAKRVGIYTGRGGFPAAGEIRELAEKLNAPVATTISGRGIIPEDHPLSVGYGFGRSGTKIARKLFSQCDCILAVGSKFSEVGTGGYGLKIPGKLIHIDANPKVLNANYPASISICADSRRALSEILEKISGREAAPRPNHCTELIRKAKADEIHDMGKREVQNEWTDPAKVFHTLRRLLPRNAVLTTDSGHHMFYALSFFPVYEPRTFLTPTNYQAMGFSVPSAIAARVALPDRQVIGTVGDGGFLMTGIELLTAIRFQLDLPILVFNDGALGLIQALQKRALNRTHAVGLVNPDFEAYARAVHAEYILIEHDGQIEPKLTRMLETKGVVLVEIRIRYPELTTYIKGQILENINRFSWGQKMRSLTRIVRRAVLPSSD